MTRIDRARTRGHGRAPSHGRYAGVALRADLAQRRSTGFVKYRSKWNSQVAQEGSRFLTIKLTSKSAADVVSVGADSRFRADRGILEPM